MSEYYYEGEDTEAALPLHNGSARRKRARADGEESAVLSYLRHVPPHARVRVVCGAFSSLLSLRGHVLDARGRFDAAEFPSLTVFYNPRVVSVEAGTVVLEFPDESPASKHIANYTRHHPCPVHGPFRCPCYIMHEMADCVVQLLREVFCQHLHFDVVVDGERNYPHLRIDGASRTWSVRLVGLPLPPRVLGPFPLGSVASPQSIKNYWTRYYEKSKVADDACVMCGIATTTYCASCCCRICERCEERCGLCGSGVCHGCSAADGRGVSVCYRCAC